MRIRTVKPEFWSDEDMATISEGAERLAVSLLNYADDEGYFHANPMLIKAALYPLREPSSNIPVMLQELSSIGYLCLCEGTDGKIYGKVTNFVKHQVISHPKQSIIKEKCRFQERSSNVPVTFHEESILNGMEQGTGNGTGNREQGPPNPRKRGKPAGAGADVVEIPEPLKSDQEFMATFERWKRHRSQLRKPLTPTCIQTQLSELAQHGAKTARLMIEQSIKHGWQGIFELKDAAPVAQGSRSSAEHDPDADLTARGAPAGEEEPMTPEEAEEIRRTEEEAEAMRGFIRQGYGRERLDQAMEEWRKARDAAPPDDLEF